MGLRAWWAALKRFDQAIIIMVIVAGLALAGLYFRSHPLKYDSSASLSGITNDVPSDSEGKRVLVIINSDSPESLQVGAYYAKKRQVPRENLVLLHTSLDESIPQTTYDKQIEAPVMAALNASKNPIDYMVFTRGVPIMITDNGYSIDSECATASAKQLMKGHKTSVNELWFIDNPYFDKDEPFSRAKFGFCLPSRLDGYSVADAEALVDNSLAAKPEKGLFLLDGTDSRTAPGYKFLNDDLGAAAKLLEAKGKDVTYDPSPNFVGSDSPLEGYASWGSNDARFDLGTYRKLKFKPGAISETFVSTSARTFRPTTGGQSLIADLIQQGITGVKGYVSEPFTFTLARPSILFDRYTSGYNLAESFWMASPTMHWKEMVIGDPLCRPYKH